jgi:hypothetical protein
MGRRVKKHTAMTGILEGGFSETHGSPLSGSMCVVTAMTTRLYLYLDIECKHRNRRRKEVELTGKAEP